MPVKLIKAVPSADYFSTIEKDAVALFINDSENRLNRKDLLSDTQVAEIFERNKSSDEFIGLMQLKSHGTFLSELEVIRMVHNYDRKFPDKIPDPNDPNKFITTARACWYSVTEILEFFKMNGIDTTKPDGRGVRFYFGLETDSVGDHSITSILVPTIDTEAEVNPVTKMSEIVHQDNPIAVSITATSNFNHGELCPTKCLGTIY